MNSDATHGISSPPGGAPSLKNRFSPDYWRYERRKNGQVRIRRGKKLSISNKRRTLETSVEESSVERLFKA